MTEIEVKIIKTLSILAIIIIARIVLKKVSDSIGKTYEFSIHRTKIIRKFISFASWLFLIIACIGIWGVHPSNLVLFIGSILTIIGVAFFAQWSILSNITSALILFFFYPFKLGDLIKILDSDNGVAGRLNDFTLFHVEIKLEDSRKVIVPNNVFLQKMVQTHSEQENEQEKQSNLTDL